jgi:hypothetical protein
VFERGGQLGVDKQILLPEVPDDADPQSLDAAIATTCGARPSVGSSMISSRGLSMSARAMANICCSPPDNSDPRLCRRLCRNHP